MKQRLRFGLVMAIAGVVGCQNSQTAEAPTAIETAKTTTNWLVTSATDLNVEPTDNKWIAHPQEPRDTSNWKGLVFRGDSVTLIRDNGEWSEVRKESGATGWIQTAYLIAGDELPQATLIQDSESYIKRGSAQAEATKLRPGSLLFILSQDETWSEVNVGKGETRWVHTSNLVTDAKELAVAKYIVQATWHTEHEGSGYNGRRLEKVLDKYPDSALLNRLAEEVPIQSLRDMGYKDDPAVEPFNPKR
jgi:SH3-like domain-containing protein